MPVTPEDHKSSEFTYTFASGKTLTLPAYGKLMTFGRARRLRKLDESEQTFVLIEEVCSEDELAVIDEMDLTETEAFFAAWQAESGVTAGESAA